MFHWICGNTRLDRDRNEVIRDKVEVTPIEDKVKEVRLRWFGHIKRKSMDAPVRRYRRGRDRLKKSWNEVIRHNLTTLGLTEDMAQGRRLWRSRIKVLIFT